MLGPLSEIIKDASTLRRMLFAAAYLAPKTPNFWGIVVEFATLGMTNRTSINTEQARILMENLKSLDEQVRSDKPSSVVVYDESLGTLPATNFHKYCSKRSMLYTQFYEYYTCSDSNTYYNDDSTELDYFMSTRETAFSRSLLKCLDAEILIGQLSYKQRAEIYNAIHYSHWVQNISKETKESVVAMIMGKRTTRNSTYYQVSS